MYLTLTFTFIFILPNLDVCVYLALALQYCICQMFPHIPPFREGMTDGGRTHGGLTFGGRTKPDLYMYLTLTFTFI